MSDQAPAALLDIQIGKEVKVLWKTQVIVGVVTGESNTKGKYPYWHVSLTVDGRSFTQKFLKHNGNLQNFPAYRLLG